MTLQQRVQPERDEHLVVDRLYECVMLEALGRSIVRQRPTRRLKSLSQLGYAATTFPSADHTRFEHALGVYHLVRLAERHSSLPKGKVDFAVLRAAALLHGIGHFALAPASELAFLKAAELVPELNAAMEDVWRVVASALRMDVSVLQARVKSGEVEGAHPYRFYRLLSSWMICQDESPYKQALRSTTNCTAQQVAVALLQRDSLTYGVLSHLDTVDQVIRDAFYHGRVRLKLNLPLYLSELGVTSTGRLRIPRQYPVVIKLAKYLNAEVYLDPRVKAAEAIAVQTLVDSFCGGAFKLSLLTKRRDTYLRQRLIAWVRQGVRRGRINPPRPEHAALNGCELRYRLVRDEIDPTAHKLLQLESRAKKPGHRHLRRLRADAEHGVYQAAFPTAVGTHGGGIETVAIERGSVKRFLKAVATLEREHQQCRPEAIAAAIWGDELVEVSYSALAEVRPFLERAINRESFKETLLRRSGGLSVEVNRTRTKLDRNEAKVVADILARVLQGNEPFKQLTDEWLIRGLNSVHRYKTMRSYLGLGRPDQAARLLSEAVERPPRRSSVAIVSRCVEYSHYLRLALPRRPLRGEITRWAFPSTKLRNRGELDSWAVVAFDGRRPLVMLNASASNPSHKKELEDRNKLEQARSYLNERFGRKLEVKTLFNLEAE